MQAAFGMLLQWTEHAVFWYMLVLNSCYAALLLMAVVELMEQWHLASDKQTGLELGAHALPPISVLVPAYNEEATIASSVVSFLTLEYPRHDVVVINDGSRDATLDVLIAQFDLYEVPPAVNVRLETATVRAYYRSRRFSRLMVIDKENGGKADSLNAGLNAARHPYVLAVDADTIIEPDALLRLSRPFTLGKSVAAIGGTVRVANGCRVAHGRVLDPRVDSRWLPGIQTVEYLRAFLFGRLGFNRIGGNMIISGAFGLFSRSHLLAIGGYEHGNVTEDLDLVVRLHRWLSEHGDPSVVTFIPDPVAWTEVPTSLAVLGRQRERWHRGLISTLWTRRTMLFNPRHGVIGMITFPFFFFGEMLAPLVELFGYVMSIAAIVSGRFDGAFALLFLSVSVGYGALLSFSTVLLEQLTFRRYTHKHDFWRMLAFALLENVGYRQLSAWWRLKAFYNVARGERGWGKMVREGFRGAALPAASPEAIPAAIPAALPAVLPAVLPAALPAAVPVASSGDGESSPHITPGDGVFTVSIMVDGARIHRVVGRESTGTALTQAALFIEEQRSHARNHRLALPKGRRRAMSFRDAATQYLERLTTTDGKDLRMKRQRLMSHLVPFFADTPLSKIGPLDVERYKHHRAQEDVVVRPRGKTVKRDANKATKTKPATINRELAVLSHLFNMAIEWGWLGRRPTRIKRLQESQGRITYLTVEQIGRLIECAKVDRNAQIYPFIVIGVATSMPRMEILSIRREHVDVDRRVIYIPKAKAGAREQPITAQLAMFLKQWMDATSDESPWLFPSPTARSGHAMDIRLPFRRVVAAAGLDPDIVVRHTLRQTAITHLVQAGVDLPTVKRISGHKTLAMVERYAHQNGAHLSAAMDTLQERLRRVS